MISFDEKYGRVHKEIQANSGLVKYFLTLLEKMFLMWLILQQRN